MLTDKCKKEKYPNYFIKEIKQFIDEETMKKIEKENGQLIDQYDDEYYEMNRRIGENDNYLCKLIRNDSVEEFVSYTNRLNLHLSNFINNQSIFETNSYLLKNTPTLIEYSAFCGSIQIFKYLFFNNAEVTSSLWPFTIHGKNADIIHFLEENKIEPKNKSYLSCINESIKCHHNDIVEYILNCLLKQNKKKNFLISLSSIKYFNYSYFPNDLNQQLIFNNLCKYNYIILVKLLLNNGDFELNYIIILK